MGTYKPQLRLGFRLFHVIVLIYGPFRFHSKLPLPVLYAKKLCSLRL